MFFIKPTVFPSCFGLTQSLHINQSSAIHKREIQSDSQVYSSLLHDQPPDNDDYNSNFYSYLLSFHQLIKIQIQYTVNTINVVMLF